MVSDYLTKYANTFNIDNELLSAIPEEMRKALSILIERTVEKKVEE